jgi:uncharacterized protein YqeY
MPLEAEFKSLLIQSMKAKDPRTSDIIRMLNTKVMEKRTAKGFTGQVDDALYLEVIGAYKKAMQKAKEEFEAVGERGKEQVEQLTWEIEFCDRFLPKGLSADELAAAVKAAIAQLGATDPKMAGRVVGEVMKHHKGKVEAAEVKRLVESELAPKG